MHKKLQLERPDGAKTLWHTDVARKLHGAVDYREPTAYPPPLARAAMTQIWLRLRTLRASNINIPRGNGTLRAFRGRRDAEE